MSSEQDPFETTRMTLAEHLNELRRRLVRGAIALVIAFGIGWYFYDQASDALLWPMHRTLEWIDRDQVVKYETELTLHPELPRDTYFQSDDPTQQTLKPELTVTQRMVAGGVGEGFAFAMRAALYVAICLGAPYFLWQMWQFIGAGLYARERRVILTFFPVSLGLFIAGVLFGYFVMVPYAFYFLAVVFPPEKVELLPNLEDYLSLLTSLTLILGAVFQLPVLMYVLVRTGIVERSFFANYRRHFIVATFVIAGILTPPDPFTQSMLAIPMLLLYEGGLLWTRIIVRKKPA